MLALKYQNIIDYAGRMLTLYYYTLYQRIINIDALMSQNFNVKAG